MDKRKFFKDLGDGKYASVKVGEEQLYVKILTVAEATELFKVIGKDGDNAMFEAEFLSKIILDKDGERFFKDDELESVANLPFWLVQQVVKDFQDENFGNLTKK